MSRFFLVERTGRVFKPSSSFQAQAQASAVQARAHAFLSFKSSSTASLETFNPSQAQNQALKFSLPKKLFVLLLTCIFIYKFIRLM